MNLNFVVQQCNDPHNPTPADIAFNEEDYAAAVQLHNYWNDAWEQDLVCREADPHPDTDDTMSDAQTSHSDIETMDDEIPGLTYTASSDENVEVDEMNTDGLSSEKPQASTKTKSKSNSSDKSKIQNKSRTQNRQSTGKATSATTKTKAASNSKASNTSKKQKKPKTSTKPNTNKNKVNKTGNVEKGTTCTKIRLVVKQSESEGSN